MSDSTSTTSGLFSLNIQDAIKGGIVSILSAVITVVQGSISTGSLTFDWKQIGTVALSAALAYLAKNFFTPGSTTTTTNQ